MDKSVDSDSSDEETQNDIRELEAALHDSDNEAASLPDSYFKYMVEVQAPKISIINTALDLNRQLDEKYKTLEQLLSQRLTESKTRLAEIKEDLVSQNKKARSVDQPKFKIRQILGSYFKDGRTGLPPENADTKIMRESNMINIFQLQRSKSWTPRDKRKMLNIMLKMSQNIRQGELITKVNNLKRELKSDLNIVRSIQVESQMQELRNDIVTIKSKTIGEVAYPIEYEYDWEVVSFEMANLHSPNECKAYWKLYLHPSINKDDWSKKEKHKLTQLAEQHNAQDWDTIATKLGTGRSAFQCFVYYKTLITKKNYVKWTAEEDEYLRRVIEYCRYGDYIPWNRVTYYIENKSKCQIYNRWRFCLEPEIKKGRFIPEEDAVLLAFINKYGKDFSKATQFIPGRTHAQLRARYNMSLINYQSAVWTVEEDKKLLQLIDDKPNTKMYSVIANHLPGKNRNSVRLRYITLKKWLENNPSSDLQFAPRRKAKKLDRERGLDLKTAVEKLKRKITGHTDPEDVDKVKEFEKSIDRRIVSYFINNLHTEASKDDICNSEISESKNGIIETCNLRNLLLLFGANLNRAKFNALASFRHNNVEGLIKETSTIEKIKTYSRKTPEIKSATTHDIWEGTPKLAPIVLLPPNFDTVVSLKSIFLNKAKLKAHKRMNISVSADDPFYIKFYERFRTLYQLTMTLSNITPRPKLKSVPETPVEEYIKTNVALEEYSDLLAESRKTAVSTFFTPQLYRGKRRRSKSDEINDNIDVTMTDEKITIDLPEDCESIFLKSDLNG